MVEKFDNIQWSLEYGSSKISVTAYDIENKCNVHKNIPIREVLGMINTDGNTNKITCSKVISVYNDYLGILETDVEDKVFSADSFFNELLHSKESWFDDRTKKEYINEVYEAIHDILNGVKKQLTL